MTFNESLTEYYKDVSKFLYNQNLRPDVIGLEVLKPGNCECSRITQFGRCDGSSIRVIYENGRPYKTCPADTDGLKFHPIEYSNRRW